MTIDLAEELSSTRVTAIRDEAIDSAASSPSLQPTKLKSSRSSSSSTSISKATTSTSVVKKQLEDMNGHATPKMEPREDTKPLKASRSAKSQPVPRVAALFDHLPDATAEATSTFAIMESCTYSNKYLGYTEHAMECDCSEEWGRLRLVKHLCVQNLHDTNLSIQIPLQRPIMPVVKILIASIERRRWSASAIALAAQHVKINAFNAATTPTSL